MLLQRLRDYDERSKRAGGLETGLPPEYKWQAIPWVLRLDTAGHLLGVVRTSGRQSKGGRDRGKEYPAPYLRRSGTNVKPQLLVDKAEFVLGLGTPEDPQRASVRHSEFVALAEACARATGDVAIESVVTFLKNLPQRPAKAPPDLSPGDFVGFQIEGAWPVERQAVQHFWAELAPRLRNRGIPLLTADFVLSMLRAGASETSHVCLVCGEVKPIARIHPVSIQLPRSISDQQVSIVSANKEAFWSYGLEQSLLAPTCTPCAEAYARGLNRLLADERTHIFIGRAAFIFWTREDVGFDFLNLITVEKPDDVRSFIESVRAGRLPAKVDDTQFYATSLSGSGGRAVVRDWIDTTVGEVRRHLSVWFSRQAIVGAWGEEPQPLGLYALAAATVRDARKELAPPTPRALLRSALTGVPLPPALLYQAVRRNRAEQRVTRPRAALIKLVLLGQDGSEKEDFMVQLDLDNPSPAYRCGRLLSVLETVQRLAVPGAKSTIVDRFFGTASSAPASVFGRLLRGAQPHLAKLERDKPGAHIALQRRLEDIQAGIAAAGFPRTLTLEEQGIFALGYYHQRAHDRAQAREASERRKAGLAPVPEEELAEGLEETRDAGEKEEN
jgi:CRISPR-associated protein Csd1